MRSLLGLAFVLSLAASVRSEDPASRAAGPAEKEKGFTPLFDGKSFEGWEGRKSVFRIADGAVIAGNLKTRIPNNEFLCSRKTFTNFELRLEAKLIGQGKNAGIQFRSRRITNHHEMIGFQADMGVSGNDHSIWGALYDESRRRKFLAEGDQQKLQKAVNTGDWNRITIRCAGNRIQIHVNGLQTVDYTEQEADIADSGHIGLQIHGGPPAEAWYRNIRIRELK